MAVTPVVSASGQGGGLDMSQIDQAFGSIYSMFGRGGPSGGGSGQFGLQPQPVSGGNDDLTRYQRSAMNLTGQAGANLFNTGAGVIGASMPVTQAGLDVQGASITPVNTGLGTLGTSLQTLQDPITFYQQLLQGNPQASAMALAPTAANINTIATGAQDAASRGGAVGGERSALMQQDPFMRQAAVTNAALGLQPAAAAALGQLAQTQAGIGQAQVGAGATEAGIGQGISQTGLGLGQLGSVLTGQGLQTLQNTIADILQKMGINIQGGTAATFSQIVGAL